LKLSDMFYEKVEKIVLGLHIVGPCHSRKLVMRNFKFNPSKRVCESREGMSRKQHVSPRRCENENGP
jgi:hypothetical protein